MHLQVYLQSYHQALTRRLQEISEQPLETCDIYFLLNFLHNIYTRYTHLKKWDWTGILNGTGTGSTTGTRTVIETMTYWARVCCSDASGSGLSGTSCSQSA